LLLARAAEADASTAIGSAAGNLEYVALVTLSRS
jgi:hypothetical protein